MHPPYNPKRHKYTTDDEQRSQSQGKKQPPRPVTHFRLARNPGAHINNTNESKARGNQNTKEREKANRKKSGLILFGSLILN